MQDHRITNLARRLLEANGIVFHEYFGRSKNGPERVRFVAAPGGNGCFDVKIERPGEGRVALTIRSPQEGGTCEVTYEFMDDAGASPAADEALRHQLSEHLDSVIGGYRGRHERDAAALAAKIREAFDTFPDTAPERIAEAILSLGNAHMARRIEQAIDTGPAASPRP